jgi:hypothetical protein
MTHTLHVVGKLSYCKVAKQVPFFICFFVFITVSLILSASQ